MYVVIDSIGLARSSKVFSLLGPPLLAVAASAIGLAGYYSVILSTLLLSMALSVFGSYERGERLFSAVKHDVLIEHIMPVESTLSVSAAFFSRDRLASLPAVEAIYGRSSSEYRYLKALSLRLLKE